MKKYLIVVHDDGETWTMASGAKLCEIGEGQFKKLEAGEYPKNLRIKGLPLDRFCVTKQDLLDAPAFTVFRGPGEKPKMQHDQWDLMTGNHPNTEVMRQVVQRGIRLIRDASGDPVHVEKDDEFCAGQSLDDLDAALAYLNNGGMVVKLPDTLTSQYFRLYAVAYYKPVKP